MSGPAPSDRFLGWARHLGEGLAHLLYPASCSVCDAPLPSGESAFCSTCQHALSHDPFPTCPRCAATVGPHARIADGCHACREQRFLFDAAIRLGPYAGTLRDVVLRMKETTGRDLAERVGALFAVTAGEALRRLEADVVIPVPLHWWRHWQRGYNQAAAVALELGDALGVPVRSRGLRRIRATPKQTSRSLLQRWANVRGAFRVSPLARLQGKTVLLVDDVMTTGSTAAEASRALRQAGAQRVVVAVLAHG